MFKGIFGGQETRNLINAGLMHVHVYICRGSKEGLMGLSAHPTLEMTNTTVLLFKHQSNRTKAVT